MVMLMSNQQTTWLVSLHRWYAEELLNGTKLHEYRRVKMGAKPGDRVLVYATYPDKVVLGEFIVGPGSLIGVTPAQALDHADPRELRSLYTYFNHPKPAKSVTALQVTQARRYGTPQTLQQLCGLDRGPHSYRKATVINEP
jgi:predicted transcriptional regulator